MKTFIPGETSFFNEDEWLKLLFLLSDTEQWVDDLCHRMLRCLPVEDKKRLFRRSYYLTATALAHILERHYYKIPRHPEAGKFNIPIPAILHWLREAGDAPAEPLPGSMNFTRVLEAPEPIGFDKNGKATCCITVITRTGGEIVTAFPGLLD
jgi:hypothetical protein